jgi:LysM repeat protein
MSSIPVVGLAKTIAAVTILLHPAAHHPASYTVHSGDSLSTIAAHTYGSSADWPAVWWANRGHVATPTVIAAGQKLRLAARCRHGRPATRRPPPVTPLRLPRRRRSAHSSRSLRFPPKLPRRYPPRARAGRAAEGTGPPSRHANPAVTGAATPATASTAAFSSPSRHGTPTAAASTRPRPTRPASLRRLPWPRMSWPARASAPGRCAGPEADPQARATGRHLPVPGA